MYDRQHAAVMKKYSAFHVHGLSSRKGEYLPDSSPKPPRPWRVIAEELAKEQDVRRVLELSRELNEALQQQATAIPTKREKSRQ